MTTDIATPATFDALLDQEALISNLRSLAIYGSDAATRERNARALRRETAKYNDAIEPLFAGDASQFKAYAEYRRNNR